MDSLDTNQQKDGEKRKVIPVAKMRAIYRAHDVERLLSKLDAEHPVLRNTYERMLEKGPERFQVKPAGLPDMDDLYIDLPNFKDPLDDMKRQLALAVDSRDGFEIAPMLLLGPPGIGKTHFAREVANLLGTGFGFISMSSLTAGWVLGGASSQWKGARPGRVFETLVDGHYANPVMVVDEIDKARTEHAYDPLGALYTLLEHDTAKEFTDEFAEVPIDASQAVWIATANDDRSIPAPILNRMTVFEVLSPDKDASRIIAMRLYNEIRSKHDWGSRFTEEPTIEILEAMSGIAPREMRRAWMTAFGNAKLDNRYTIEKKDLPKATTGRRGIGFGS